jgi:DMSO reductase family type II enzyme heme b subunit
VRLQPAFASSALAAQETAPGGKEVYDRWCAGCHGEDGRGAGPGAQAMLPKPRDFTRALYQIRSTGSGELPTDADILRMIDEGMPGTAMPGWRTLLTQAERQDLVQYLKSFSRFFEGATVQPLEFTSPPGVNEERLVEGRQVFETLECFKCHGQMGRGDGESARDMDDDQGVAIAPRDLTRNWLFNGGGSVEEIYRRLRTGLDGTPMASFEDALNAGIVTDDQLWSVSHYVRSLSPEEPPEILEVIAAELLEEGELPTTVDDERWSDVGRFYIPMVGQIVVKPRWFDPRVTGVWVQALHNREEVALLVSWTDPSRSPDPAWAVQATRFRDAMQPHDEGADWAPGAPDQLVVQFPQQIPTGMERPYFLQGDARRPAYLWRWRSDAPQAEELVATGLGTGNPQDPSSVQLQVASAHADGEWRVLFRRALATPDSTADLQIPLAQAVPVAFQAWDGDHGEAGNQGSISTWYFIQLQEETPVTVYVTPALAMLLTAGLGLLVVVRAQKREQEGTGGGAGGE